MNARALALRDAFLRLLGREYARNDRPWEGLNDLAAELSYRLGGRPSGAWTAEDIERDLAPCGSNRKGDW